MQSIFRLPWCSEQLKLSEKAHLDKMRPVVEIPGLAELKRKRSESLEAPPSPARTQPAKKQQTEFARSLLPAMIPARLPDQAPVPQPVQSRPAQAPASAAPRLVISTSHTQGGAEMSKSKTSPEPQPAAMVSATPRPSTEHSSIKYAYDELARLSGITPLQQVIENEFNMAILHKHNELRLIEQELAKCQIALEQLRRCELRPFPGATQPSLHVHEGTGAAILPPPGATRPSHPAPYGVTDGPYSRHYRQWLLHDPQFESISAEALALADASTAARPTRGAGHVRKSASKSLGSSTRAPDPGLSIPNYPPAQTKEKAAFQTLRRSTDGQLVKLTCNNCLRSNFSSIQGFLNHCRIAHKVEYKSHDQAAVDCGRLLDQQELASLPAEAHAAHVPKPSASRASTSAASTPAKVQPPSHLVHPLNTNAGMQAATPRPMPKVPAAPVSRVCTQPPSCFSSTPFKASSQAPRLSAYMEKENIGGNLEQAIANARAKIEFQDEDLLSPDTPSDFNSPLTPFGPAGRASVGGKQGYFPRPPSRKGYRQPAQRPRPSPLAPASPHDMHTQSQLSSPGEIGSAMVSPGTVDGNPGLVSDHEDDDHSVSEEDLPQTEIAARPPLSTGGRRCSDEMEIDIEEENVDGMDRGVLIRRNSMLASEARGIRSAGSPSRK